VSFGRRNILWEQGIFCFHAIHFEHFIVWVYLYGLICSVYQFLRSLGQFFFFFLANLQNIKELYFCQMSLIVLLSFHWVMLL